MSAVFIQSIKRIAIKRFVSDEPLNFLVRSDPFYTRQKCPRSKMNKENQITRGVRIIEMGMHDFGHFWDQTNCPYYRGVRQERFDFSLVERLKRTAKGNSCQW